MYKSLFVLTVSFVLFSTVSCGYTRSTIREWEFFKAKYNKFYPRRHVEETRLKIFADSLNDVQRHNKLFEQGIVTYKRGVNQFSDLRPEEFVKQTTSFDASKLISSNNEHKMSWDLDAILTNLTNTFDDNNSINFTANYNNWIKLIFDSGNLTDSAVNSSNFSLDFFNWTNYSADSFNWTNFDSNNSTEDETIPDTIDWRNFGAVTSVKNQGPCKASWAFSAIGALEGQHFLNTGKLVKLSEQYLIDCSRKFNNLGCNGGATYFAFDYIKRNKGVPQEYLYSYKGIDGKCRKRKPSSGTAISNYVDVLEGDEEELRRAVGTVGPVSVAFNVMGSFASYKDGVYYEENCSPKVTSLKHAMLVVGYGTTKQGADYWLLKNSWGRSWGNNGYAKVARNINNNCGIATAAFYPIIRK